MYLKLIKNLLLSSFILFKSFSVFAYEWNFETLNPVFQGCIKDAEEGSDFEYCGCYVNSISKKYGVLEVVDLFNSGKLESSQDYLNIVQDCVIKSF